MNDNTFSFWDTLTFPIRLLAGARARLQVRGSAELSQWA